MASKPTINPWFIVAGLVLLVPLVAVLYGGFGKDPHAVPSMLVGKAAPAFDLAPVGGGDPVSLAALRGRPVVVNFWATWCLPCKAEHPLLQSAAQAYPKVTFLGVVFNDTPEKMSVFLKQNGHKYPQLIDPGGRIAIDYGVTGVPETFVIDAEGRIATKWVGEVSQDQLVQALDPMVGS